MEGDNDDFTFFGHRNLWRQRNPFRQTMIYLWLGAINLQKQKLDSNWLNDCYVSKKTLHSHQLHLKNLSDIVNTNDFKQDLPLVQIYA